MGYGSGEGAAFMPIKWLDEAINDLINIRRFIARDKPGAAQKMAEKIKTETRKLLDYPSAGRSGRVEGTRELVIAGTPYYVPYRVKKQRIEILRVLHGAMKR
jgi:toxin ParE1/3/4